MKFNFLFAIVIGIISAGVSAADHPILWYDKPAEKWVEALPVGNGKLGAMIYGGTTSEKIQLNEDTIWEGYPHDPNNPEALKNLPHIRELLFAGKDEEAQKLIAATMMGIPPRIKSYQPLGDLMIESLDAAPAPVISNYRRQLDLFTGIATTRWTSDGVTFTRKVFASYPDHCIVVQFDADKPGKINVKLALKRNRDASLNVDEPNRTIRLTGQIASQYVTVDKKPFGPVVAGMRFVGELRAILRNGTFNGDNNSLAIHDADALTLIVVAKTDYLPTGNFDRNLNLQGICDEQLARLTKDHSYEDLLTSHSADFRSLMQRVDLDLGSSSDEQKALPTDRRITRLKESGQFDPELFSAFFQFGRYLLASSSRPGSMPANLQGIWNDQFNAAWNSDYHTNINIQMNYWPAEVTNLSECHLPLFDFMDALSVPGSKTAKVEYGAGGWVVHHLTDPFLTTTPCDGPMGVWPMGAAWLCQHPWEHYAFTGDRDFLEKRAYPLMKGASQFILDFLVPAPANTPNPGKLVTCPSHSPENKFIDASGKVSSLTYGATMDLEIIHDLLTHTIKASEILNTDPEFRQRCQQALDQLAPLQISKKDGRLQEWIEDYKEQDPHHRHASHLFAVYPGDQITLRGTPELAKAAEKSLEARTDRGATEWAMAWRAAIWARFKQAEKAEALLNMLVSTHLYPNMFAKYPPFQIDGNLGATAAVAEMLLQSQGDEIQLLPALPSGWANGHVTGLCARGGFVVDMMWDNGHLASATIHSRLGGKANVRVGEKLITLDTTPGGNYSIH